MMAATEIDCEVEHQKLKDKLSLFKDVLAKKKEIEDEERLLASNKSEAEATAKTLEEMSKNLQSLVSEWDSLGKDHEAKKTAWETKSELLQGLIFNGLSPRLLGGTTTEQVANLRAATELAKENATLFEQHLRLEELSLVAQTEESEITNWKCRLSIEENYVSDSNLKLDNLKAALEGAKEDWRRKWAEQLIKSTQVPNSP